MKQLGLEMVNDLIKIYKEYINSGRTEEVKRKAMVIESKYLNSSPLVNSELTNARGKLTCFYADLPPGPISKEKAKIVVAKLEKLKSDLEH